MTTIETNLLAVKNENNAILTEMALYSYRNDNKGSGWGSLAECVAASEQNAKNRNIMRERIKANEVLFNHVNEVAWDGDVIDEIDFLIYKLTFNC